ncbi:MAG: hypothetical protein NC114_12100 [Ruminococcus flavefaciens]|nr:hypothetical protein [Ruminococcus flavefaciens]
MTIFIIDILFISILVFVVLRENRLHSHRLRSKAQAQLDYIHILIETVYVYGNNHELLSKRLKQEMSAKKLLLYGIIERKRTEADDPELKISEDDRLLYQLLHEGFSPRELCIIFSLSNINSLYVKHHRIRKKLGLLSETPEKPESDNQTHIPESPTSSTKHTGPKQQCMTDRTDKNSNDTVKKEAEPAEV